MKCINSFLVILFATIVPKADAAWDKAVIDDYVESVRSCRGPPAVTIAIIEVDENNEIVQSYANAYGRVDPTCETSNCNRPTNSTRFCIGSITKQFTSGVLGMTLKQSEMFSGSSWDTKLTAILGDRGRFFGGEAPAKLVTLRDLLAHRMGIPRHDGGWLFGIDKPRDDVLSNIHTLNSYDPSEYWRSSFVYNNWMIDLSGYVAEQLSASAYEDLVQKYYFNSLEMQDARFIHKVGENFDGFAVVALKTANGWESVPLWQIGNFSAVGMADGSICASSNDFVNYMKFLLTNQKSSQKLNEQQKKLLEVIQNEAWLPSNLEDPIWMNEIGYFTYGFGWDQGIWGKYAFQGHDGAIEGWYSSLKVFPEARVGVFVSTTNSIDGDDYTYLFADWLTDYILGYEPGYTNESACSDNRRNKSQKKLLRGASRNVPHEKDTFTFACDLTEAEAQPYLGTYEHPMFGLVTVSYSFANKSMRWSFGYFGRGSLCKTVPTTELGLDDFRMHFDEDTYYKIMNDPLSNLDYGCVFSFKRNETANNAWALDLRIVEWEVPVIFPRTGISTSDTSSEISITTTASSRANNLYFHSIFIANVISIVVLFWK